jgi:hypothetical protein
MLRFDVELLDIPDCPVVDSVADVELLLDVLPVVPVVPVVPDMPMLSLGLTVAFVRMKFPSVPRSRQPVTVISLLLRSIVD